VLQQLKRRKIPMRFLVFLALFFASTSHADSVFLEPGESQFIGDTKVICSSRDEAPRFEEHPVLEVGVYVPSDPACVNTEVLGASARAVSTRGYKGQTLLYFCSPREAFCRSEAKENRPEYRITIFNTRSFASDGCGVWSKQ
jgi:hypothetical protein